MITKQDAIDIIKDELGLTIVNLELSDANIERNIKRALMTMSSYYSSPTYKTVELSKDSSGSSAGGYINLTDIDPEGVSIVTSVYPTSNILRADAALLGLGSMYFQMGLALDTQIQTYSNMISRLALLDSILGRNAKVVGDKLFVDHFFSNVTVAYIPSKIDIEKISDGEWLKWVLEYATALSKRQLAQTRGKYIVTSNPVTTNAETLLSEANETIQRLEEALTNKGVLIATRY